MHSIHIIHINPLQIDSPNSLWIQPSESGLTGIEEICLQSTSESRCGFGVDWSGLYGFTMQLYSRLNFSLILTSWILLTSPPISQWIVKGLWWEIAQKEMTWIIQSLPNKKALEITDVLNFFLKSNGFSTDGCLNSDYPELSWLRVLFSDL